MCNAAAHASCQRKRRPGSHVGEVGKSSESSTLRTRSIVDCDARQWLDALSRPRCAAGEPARSLQRVHPSRRLPPTPQRRYAGDGTCGAFRRECEAVGRGRRSGNRSRVQYVAEEGRHLPPARQTRAPAVPVPWRRRMRQTRCSFRSMTWTSPHLPPWSRIPPRSAARWRSAPRPRPNRYRRRRLSRVTTAMRAWTCRRKGSLLRLHTR